MGSGLSGECIEEQGHMWMGLDISQAMLDIAGERELEGDLACSDLGEGLPFRAGAFDGAISISALQWLCNADKTYHKPHKRLYKFFLVLMTGGSQPLPQGLGQEESSQSVGARFESRREKYKNMRGKSVKKSKDWILEKKERARKKGKDVRPDSKFTGRKRKDKW